jgi:hypothetical protein
VKQKDIALILVVVFISGLLSFFISDWLIGDPESQQMEAEVIDMISADFTEPDIRHFNAQSINPTQLIRIGDEQGNQSPFGQQN